MKPLPDPKVYVNTLKDVHKLIHEKFGDAAGTDFDTACIEKYEVVYQIGKPYMVNVIYNQIKVSHDNISEYWKIQSHKEEYNLEAGLKFIKELT